MNSSSEITHGARANKTGNNLEKFVERTLQEHGYTYFEDHKKQLFENRLSIGGKQYSIQVPVGESIYKTTRKADFLIINKDKFPETLVVECKWQQVAGSVDEKYPFLYFNIMKCGVPTVVLIDGDGYKQAAKDWLTSMADPKRALIHVWTMAEFQRAVNDGFLG